MPHGSGNSRTGSGIAAPLPAALQNNNDLQDILSFTLHRAPQLSEDIAAHFIAATELPAPATMGQTFDLLAQTDIVVSLWPIV